MQHLKYSKHEQFCSFSICREGHAIARDINDRLPKLCRKTIELDEKGGTAREEGMAEEDCGEADR